MIEAIHHHFDDSQSRLQLAATRRVGPYGWGRIDMVENRRVGIKSRENYECPGALALLLAFSSVLPILAKDDPSWGHPKSLAVALALLSTVPIAWRTRWPIAAARRTYASGCSLVTAARSPAKSSPHGPHAAR